jgi:hypothetical protein
MQPLGVTVRHVPAGFAERLVGEVRADEPLTSDRGLSDSPEPEGTP